MTIMLAVVLTLALGALTILSYREVRALRLATGDTA